MRLWVSGEPWKRAGFVLMGIVLAGLALRAIVALGVLGGMPLISDAAEFADEAKGMLEHGHPRWFYWPPGNTLLLVVFFRWLGPGAFAARIAMVVVSGLTVLLAARIGGLLGGRRAGIAAAAVGALYAPAVLLCGQSYSQHLAGLCLSGVAYYGYVATREGRAGAWLSCGLFLGVGCLTRPSMLSVTPVLLAFAAVAVVRALRAGEPARGSRIAAGVAGAAICAGLCVAPAIVHNHRWVDDWTISTNNERNLFLGNNAYTHHYKTSHLAQRPLESLPAELQVVLRDLDERPSARSDVRQAAVQYMVAHPWRTLYRVSNRARAFWGFDYLASRGIGQHGTAAQRRAAPAFLLLEAGVYLAVTALATAALATARRSLRRRWTGWLLALVVAYQIPYLAAFSGGTYHFPVMGLIWPFAGVALVRLREEGLSRFVRGLGVRGLGALAVLGAIQIEYFVWTARMAGP